MVDINNICFKCLEERSTEKYIIEGRGYGSIFDSFYSYIQVCEDCKVEGLDLWFNETPEIEDEFIEKYKYEDDIKEYLNTFPVEGQELFWNSCSSAPLMSRQDWIDMHLGKLPDYKYEEYGMISPRQDKAYEERFPSCAYPVNVVYSDGSKGCLCPFGATGEYGQEPSSTSVECYSCTKYKEREYPIKEMSRDMYKKYEEYVKAKHIVEKYKDLFS